MSIDSGQLGSIGGLAEAIGLLRHGTLSGEWFTDPVGGPNGSPGLSTMLHNDAQRDALVAFVDEVLGAPPRRTASSDSGREVWVPLVTSSDPAITLSVVVRELPGIVHVGVGLEHTTGSPTATGPTIATTVHVPVFQVDREGSPSPPGGDGLPDWLLLGRAGGRIALTVDVTLGQTPAGPGDPSLGGAAVALAVPTSEADDVGLSVTLRDLRLPGASEPRTFTLDATSLDDIGEEVLELLLGLVSEQAAAIDPADAATRPFSALTGLLGLRHVPGIPPFPLAQLPSTGVAGLVSWATGMLADATARDAWLGELAALVGGALDASRGAVTWTQGSASVSLGVRVTDAVSGSPTLVPWVDVRRATRADAAVSLYVDLLSADTATGAVSAVPTLRGEALFGTQAGGSPLLSGGTAIGGMRVGLVRRDGGAPAATLTLHDCELLGRSYPVLDLSTPQAALDAAADAIDSALAAALSTFGEAGDMVAAIVGLSPPTGVSGPGAVALVADPVDALARYWAALLASADGTADVLGSLHALVTGAVAAPVAGSGTATDPWSLPLSEAVHMALHREGDALHVGLRAARATDVLTDYRLSASVDATLAVLDTSTRAATFLTDLGASATLRAVGSNAVRLDLGEVALQADALVLGMSYRPVTGLAMLVDAPGLVLEVAPSGPARTRGATVRIPVSMASLADGSADAAEWEALQDALTLLLSQMDSPVVDAALSLLGWTGHAGRLRLAAVVDDPAAALQTWLAEVLLDCDTVRAAMRPVTALLSGFTASGPTGSGTRERPYRCSLAGADRAPAAIAWMEPGCPPPPDSVTPFSVLSDEPPEAADVVAVLTRAARSLAAVDDLLVARPGLVDGLTALLDRWSGTDGVVGEPATLPTDVTSLRLDGFGYDELVSLGRSGGLVGQALDGAPHAVVHVGCEPGWLDGVPSGQALDATGVDPARIDSSGDGVWFVRLPAQGPAAADRPDLTPLEAQAAPLTQVLAGRTDPITVLGYGSAGAAALLAASHSTVVSHAATVGAPWGPVSVHSMSSGLGGDALRLLDRLQREDTDTWPDLLLALECTPLERMRRLVARSMLAASSLTLPGADDVVVREGLAVTAVFGALDDDDLATGLGAFVHDGVEARAHAAREAAVRGSGDDAGDGESTTSLHIGADLPVMDLDLGGVRIGAGATLELARVATDADGLVASRRRDLTVTTRLAVTDGWLAGGPGSSTPDIEVRWVEVVVDIPLTDGSPATADGVDSVGRTRVVLHDARAFEVRRERWVVDVHAAASDDPDVTGLLPEARIILSEVVARLRSASSDLASLLDVLGWTRDDGLDPDALDRWFYDTTAIAAEAVQADPAGVASALRTVTGTTGTGSTVTWSSAPASATVDLATGDLQVSVSHPPQPGLPATVLTMAAIPGQASAHVTVGTLDPDSGGLVLRGTAGTGHPATLGLTWQKPGSTTPVETTLLPVPDVAGVVDLLQSAAPAAVGRAVLQWLRATLGSDARSTLETVLDGLDLLDDAGPNTHRPIRLPLGLVCDPAGWLRHGARAWRTDMPAQAVALLDALAPWVGVGDGVPAAGTWQLSDDVRVDYRVEGRRLRLVADVAVEADVDAVPVRTNVTAGVVIGQSGPPAPVLDATGTLEGAGLALSLSPTMRLRLVRPGQPPIDLVPASGGIGSLVAGVGEAVLPLVLEELRSQRIVAAGTVLGDVGSVVHELAQALDLLGPDGAIEADRVGLFATDPVAWTASRLPAMAANGLAMLAGALDPAGTTVVATSPTPTSTRVVLGAGASVAVVLDGAGDGSISVSGSVDVVGVGRVELAALRLSASQVGIDVRIGPVPVTAGSVTLRPLLVLRTGLTSSAVTSLLGVGLALDDAGAQSVEVRWAVDGSAPVLVPVDRAASGETLGSVQEAGLRLLSVAVSVAASVALDAVSVDLAADATDALRGVLLTDLPGSRELDPAIAADLLDPPALLDRLLRLAWNLATGASPPALGVGGLTVALASESAGGARRRLGVRVSLTDRVVVAPGETQVELDVDPGWITGSPAGGLSLFVLEGIVDGTGVDLDVDVGLTVAGLGIRVVQTTGPLLDMGGLSLDAIAVHTFGTVSASGVGGGVRLALEGLAFAPSAQGGSNAVATSMLADAGSAQTSARPSLSPAFAVQKHPGEPLAVSLRAGEPPGPWWVILQRQLGPLYLEGVGLDTAESGGSVTRVTLLFTGSVEIAGLTAAVDRLSLSWQGGDLFSAQSWVVDLQGLAVSADMSGVVLAGGLLKTTQDGTISYVGMLMGRFGIYGLSVFGGYTEQDGSPSFFVFGALNGPIGGPPAFFVTGIGGGLGINRGLRVPDDMAQLDEYPFIKALDPAASAPDDPMAELRSLSEYFPPQSGTFWFAAGISFTSFALVDGIAVVSVAFGNGLEVSLFGLARMALPRPQAALVSIELGLLARFSTEEGLFLIQAQLTDNSWLLYPQVRLTGGFAFATWWKGPLAGQFVLTIGGYHPSFDNPGYPVVPRLGLVWQVSDDIVVKGGAYFALTSEALMAGVDVEVSADFGWAWARISFGAHGIVYFDPFWFEVSAYARISAGVKIKTFLGTVRFSISLGARITVSGPDFHGTATLEVGPCEFTVSFGSRTARGTTAVDWPTFVTKYLEDAGGGTARALSSVTGDGTLPAATGGSTAAPTPDGSAQRPFEVFAEFEVTIVTTIPAQTVIVGTRTHSNLADRALGLAPMQHAGLVSTLSLTLQVQDPATGRWRDASADLSLFVESIGTEGFPLGVWGAPLDDKADIKPLPRTEVVRAGSTVSLVSRAVETGVGPVIDFRQVESGRRTLPLRATGDDRAGLLRLAADVTLPTPTTAAAALDEAQRLLFGASAATATPRLRGAGRRSGVAAASFAGERSAPPLFGSLADGLAPRNGTDAPSARQAPSEPPAAVPLRDPYVSAYVPAADLAPTRPTATSVADSRIKRRPAPSTDSVRARVSRSLPVQLGTVAPPAVVTASTVVAAGPPPHTAAPGLHQAYTAGPLALGMDSGLVGGLRPAGTTPRGSARRRVTVRAGDPGSAVRAGDVIVLTMPDVDRDVDTRPSARPGLEITGSARVVAVGADGTVLLDQTTSDGTVAVPAGVALLAAQADGVSAVTDGFAGWHQRSWVVHLGRGSALGAGCVLRGETAHSVSGHRRVTAQQLLVGSGAVTTRFTQPAETVVVLLESAAPERLDPLALELDGARVATAADGTDVAAVVTVLGDTTALLYAVEPDPDGHDSSRPVSVRVRAGGDWVLTGVMATSHDPGTAARLLAERGVAAVTGRLAVTSGPGCQVRWHPGRSR